MKMLLFIVMTALFLALPARAQGIRPEQMYERGKASLENGDAEVAVKRLRIASFGLLSDAPRYANALVYLAVALRRSGDLPGAEKVIAKLAEVERIKPVLASLDIAPGIYADFSKLASASVNRTPSQFAAMAFFLRNKDSLTKQPNAKLGSEDRN